MNASDLIWTLRTGELMHVLGPETAAVGCHALLYLVVRSWFIRRELVFAQRLLVPMASCQPQSYLWTDGWLPGRCHGAGSPGFSLHDKLIFRGLLISARNSFNQYVIYHTTSHIVKVNGPQQHIRNFRSCQQTLNSEGYNVNVYQP